MTSRTRTSLGGLTACLVLGLLGTSTCHGSGDGIPLDGVGGGAGDNSSSGTGSRPGGGDAGASSSGGNDGGPGGLTPCQDAEECSSALPVCHPDRRICVECVVPDDCDGEALCQRNVCVPVTTCANSLQCGDGLVCVKDEPDASEGLCLECGTAADCGDDGVCVDFTCRTGCGSDTQCTPMGLLCDLAGGFCVECLDASACDDGAFCDAGACAPQVCTPDATSCAGDAVATCNAMGSGFGPPQSCGDYPCAVEDGMAACSFPPSTAPPNALNTNGDFSAGGTGWTVENPVGSAAVPAMPMGQSICANNESLLLGWPADAGDAAMLETGQSYTLHVRATATGSSLLELKVGEPTGNYAAYNGEPVYDLSAGTIDIEDTFIAPMSGAAGIALTLAAGVNQLCVTNIWLVPND